MKKALSFLMAVALLASSAPLADVLQTDSLFAPAIEASAANEGTLDGSGFYYRDYNDYVEITGYDIGPADDKIEIPSAINQKPVTKIAADAFADETKYGNLTEITVPTSIEYIGKNAFSGCTNVTIGYLPTKFVAICAVAKRIDIDASVQDVVSFELVDSDPTLTKVMTDDGLASLYTKYRINTNSTDENGWVTLADRGLAVPKEVSEADLSDLTSGDLQGFIEKRSAIEQVWFWNRDSSISLSDISLAPNAVIWGYRQSTAKNYAASYGKQFEPIDGAESEETIKENITLDFSSTDEGSNQKLYFAVNAQTNGYEVNKIGIIFDRTNSVTEDTAEELLVLKEDDYSKAIFADAKVGSATGTSEYTARVADYGLGVWIRPYVIVDSEAKNEDGSAKLVVKYGTPEFVYAEEAIRSKISAEITSSVGVTAKGAPGVRFDVSADKGQYDYDYVKTGFVADRTGTVTEDTASEQLTVDSDLEGLLKGSTNQNADYSYSAMVADKGYGAWAVGYITVSLNGNEITKYTEPVYGVASTPLDDVNVSIEPAALSAAKFKFDVIADTEKSVKKTGVVLDKTGAVTKESAASDLTLDSALTSKVIAGKENTAEYICNLMDVGNGIWAVGYVTIEENGKEYTKYTEPVYVYNESKIDGVDISLTSSVASEADKKYRFDVVTRTGGDEIVQSGVVFDRTDAIKSSEDAKKYLTLDSKLASKTIGGFDNPTDLGTQTNYAANITDKGKGIWVVGYSTTVDADGNQTTTYTDPVYIASAEDTVKANISVRITDSLYADNANKVRFDVTAVTGSSTVKKSGVVFDRAGIVNASTAAAALTVDADPNKYTIGGTADNAPSNIYSAGIADKGKGIWIVGYVTVEVDGETITKYSDPIYVFTGVGVSADLTYAPVAGTDGKYRFDVSASTGDYNPEAVGIVFDRTGDVTADTAKDVLKVDSSYTVGKNPSTSATTYSANITDKGEGIWIVGYMTVTDSTGQPFTKYSEPIFVSAE